MKARLLSHNKVAEFIVEDVCDSTFGHCSVVSECSFIPITFTCALTNYNLSLPIPLGKWEAQDSHFQCRPLFCCLIAI